MNNDLLNREANLLAKLTEIDSEASRLLLAYETLNSESKALRTDLRGLREDILREFLTDNLVPLGLDFTIKLVGDDIFISVIAAPDDGEVEFSKLKTALPNVDTDNIPVVHLLNYVGKGIPWGSREAKL